jgi:peptide deformylase
MSDAQHHGHQRPDAAGRGQDAGQDAPRRTLPRPILQVGDPVLRERAREVVPEDLPALQDLIDDMIATMRAAGGAGLAANQIGDLHRILVAEVDHNPRYPYKPPLPLTVMINPVIEPLGDETLPIIEGCLSVPNLRGELERFKTIRVRYLDRDGNPGEATYEGLSAGTFQHEVDHLDGLLFLDRVTDPRTFMTWEEFERHHRDAWLARIGLQ